MYLNHKDLYLGSVILIIVSLKGLSPLLFNVVTLFNAGSLLSCSRLLTGSNRFGHKIRSLSKFISNKDGEIYVLVDSNDVLYGSDPKFLAEINKMCTLIIDEILNQLKVLGAADLHQQQVSCIKTF